MTLLIVWFSIVRPLSILFVRGGFLLRGITARRVALSTSSLRWFLLFPSAWYFLSHFIILLLFVFITNDLVSIIDLFESVLMHAAGAIGMVLVAQLVIRVLDILVWGRFSQSQILIVVLLWVEIGRWFLSAAPELSLGCLCETLIAAAAFVADLKVVFTEEISSDQLSWLFARASNESGQIKRRCW